MNFRSKLVAVVGSALILASSITAGGAQTATDAKVNIQTPDGATLSVSTSGGSFGTVPYKFEDQTASGKLTVTASDPRGTGAGWNVQLKGTDFSAGNNRVFSITNLRLDAGSQTAVAPSGASLANMQTYAVPQVQKNDTKIWSAQPNSGMGTYKSEINGTLTIPGGTLVGEYTSRLDVTIATGP